MSCGIICKLDHGGYTPFPELARIRRFVDSLPGPDQEPKVDQFERWLFGGLGVLAVIFGVAILCLLAYGVASTAVAALWA